VGLPGSGVEPLTRLRSQMVFRIQSSRNLVIARVASP
jgi:hypothetical protein